jgi:hypothetical protein
VHQRLAERCVGKSTVEPPNELAALPAPKLLSEEDQPPTTLAQRCDWCSTHFSPRRGSGGSQQRFCSDECRRISNRECQRTRRKASYAGRSTLPASGQPPQTETLSREPAVAALRPWETGVLDIANCQRTEFVVALKDGETAGMRIETWPAEVRAFTEQHVNR